MSENKTQTKETEKKVPGIEVKQAFQFNGKRYHVGDKAPKAIAEKKELKGFF